MHGSWAATGHTSVRQALRCFSVGPCHACRRGRFRRLLGLSKVRAGRLGTWRPHCSNTDRYSGALDDRRARRLGNRYPGGTLCAAAPSERRTSDGGPQAPTLTTCTHPTSKVLLPRLRKERHWHLENTGNLLESTRPHSVYAVFVGIPAPYLFRNISP